MPGEVAGAAAVESTGVEVCVGALGVVVVVWAKRESANTGKIAKTKEAIAMSRRKDARRDPDGRG